MAALEGKAPGGLRVIFAGTPAFAVQALDAILGSRHAVVGVFSQPDRPSGRGQKLQPSAVKQRALQAGLPVFQPQGLRLREAVAGETDEARQGREARNAEVAAAIEAMQGLAPDVMVVAAYGLLLPQAVLDVPRFGCLNIHASLLPRWRGAAPIQRAIAAGDAETGVGIMQMEAGLDTGPVGIEHRTPISDADTAATLHDRLAAMGAQAIVEALDALAGGALHFRPQPAEGVTHAAKVDKHEARIDWQQPAEVVSRHIRAFDPPGSVTQLADAPDGQPPLRVFDPLVLSHDAVAGSQPPGSIHAVGAAGIDVVCAPGIIRLQAVQRPGGRRQAVDAFLRGHPLSPGARFS